ncbi:GAF domain-containing sensor histidine kinase [Paenibacillus wulumuqiensis]|uniref:GAF domain-containing sensor histidine kinase n=1 Tax=Paenibacillus wulumuqiensis TaxID=1567107 RepID=UPI000695A519|nr:ATP-binding protein [Paenibacillus wulumuqiensis]
MIQKLFFDNVVDAARHITDMLSSMLKVNTIFVASNDGKTNHILKAFNRDQILVEEGIQLPLQDTYCGLVSRKVVYISHTLTHPYTCELPVTANTGDHSFIGFPVLLQNGESFGTVCALHTPGYIFSKSEVKTMHSMAIFLSYVVELENRLEQQIEINDDLIQDHQQVTVKLDDLKQQKEEVDLQLQYKSDTMAILSHEIRNPLNGVISMVELLEPTPLNPEQRSHLDIIRKSSHTLMEMLDNVLDFSKMEAGEMQVDMELFDLPALVEESTYLFAAKAMERNIEIILEIEENIPILYGDTRKIRQILINLISNAVKFTQKGDVHIQAQVLPESNSDEVSVKFSVTDTGIGIDDQQLDQLFERYVQVHNKQGQYKGTGLGLLICRQLVELMGGQIIVSSIKGKGSTFAFILTLPRHEFSVPTFRQPILQGKRMLVVDDNDKALQWVSRLAEDWDIQLSQTDRIEEMLRRLEKGQSFDVIMLDHELVATEKQTVIRQQIEQLQQMYGIPVILLTSVGMTMDPTLRTWSKSVVSKPVRRSYLMNALIFALTDTKSNTTPSS